MLTDWIIYILLGRLSIWLWMNFPLPNFIQKIKTVEYLHGCDLCGGVWVYAFLAFFMQMDLLGVVGFYYVPFLSEMVTGMVISFLVHIFILGWHTKFDVVVI